MKRYPLVTSAIILFAILAIPHLTSTSILAQEAPAVPGDSRTTALSPMAIDTIRKEITIGLSQQDVAIWTNISRNMYGDWTTTLPTDVELLSLEFVGDSYEIDGNVIRWHGLNGYYKLIYRTVQGIRRDGRYLIYASGWSISEPFDLNAQINFPEFYGNYIVSITPGGYTQGPGRIGWNLTSIREWSFEVKFDLQLKILAAAFPDGNKTLHHTTQWPDYVFRRAQWLSAQVEFEGTFNSTTDSLRWSVKGPGQTNFVDIAVWTPGLPGSAWSVREGSLVGTKRIDELYIPAGAAIGQYTLKVGAYRNTGQGSLFQSSKTTPSFYVIFNPWNDDDDPRYDTDVHNPSFNGAELDVYAKANSGKNYYPDGSSSVDWILSPFSRAVFLPVINEIAGISSARDAMRRLVDKTRWDDGTPADSEILQGRWGWSLLPYKVNWRDVPAIMSEWNNGQKHPTGQCMDFGGLVTAFAQAIGIPARMLTCVNCADGHGGVWNFHVWDEVWINEVNSSSWSPADGTYNVGPTTRQESFIQEEVGTSTGIYTFDARTNSKINILSDYRSWSGTVMSSEQVAHSPEAIVLSIGTSRSQYDFGETVTILVTTTNTSATGFSGTLQNNIALVDYAGAHQFYTFPERAITVPAGGTLVQTYTLAQSDYKWNGEYQALATLGTAKANVRFGIQGGLALLITTPSQVVVGQPMVVTLRVTNRLSTQVSSIAVDIRFPSSTSGASNPTSLNIPSLGAGQTYIASWTISLSDPGTQLVVAYTTSGTAGYGRAETSFIVLGRAQLAVRVDVPESVTPGVFFNATARVQNVGGLNATGVQAVLSLPNGLTSSTSTTVSLGDLTPAQERTISWPLTASAAGVYALQVRTTETSVGDEEITPQLVVAVQTPHRIALSASQRTVIGLRPATIVLTLRNFGAVQDSVFVEVVSDNPTIGFALSDGGSPLTGAVTVPANGSHDLALVVYPHQWESGIMSVKAVSRLDPNAVDFTTISVSGRTLTTYLPMVTRDYVPPVADPCEPNDSMAQAFGPLQSGVTYQALINPDSDKDYYYFDIATLGKVTVDLSNVKAPGADIDMNLYRADGLRVGGSWGTTDTERVVFEPLTTGRYYVYVYFCCGTNDPTWLYRLRVEYNGSRGSGDIYGTVRAQGAVASNVPIALGFWDSSTYEFRRVWTLTGGDGRYHFWGMETLGSNQMYYPYYSSVLGSSYIGYWYSPDLTSYTAGTAAFGGDMDISALNLGTPNSSTAIPLPVTFTWTPRSTSPTESYRLALWDPDDYNIQYDTDNLGHAGSFTLWGLPSGFTTGHRYRWVVYAYDGNGGYGGSYYSNSVAFSSAGANTIDSADSSPNQDRLSRSGDKETPAEIVHPSLMP